MGTRQKAKDKLARNQYEQKTLEQNAQLIEHHKEQVEVAKQHKDLVAEQNKLIEGIRAELVYQKDKIEQNEQDAIISAKKAKRREWINIVATILIGFGTIAVAIFK